RGLCLRLLRLLHRRDPRGRGPLLRLLRHHAVHAGAGALAGGAAIVALTPGPRCAAIQGSASPIASSNFHGGLITASPQAASLPGSIEPTLSSIVRSLYPPSAATKAWAAASSLIGYHTA